jgi:hypothetical protein
MPTINDVRSWRGQDLIDAEGGKIGSIEEIYLDSDTDQVEWALVTTGLFGSKQSFVPLDGAWETAEGIRVAFDKGIVKDARRSIPTAGSPSRRRHSCTATTGASTPQRAWTRDCPRAERRPARMTTARTAGRAATSAGRAPTTR